MGLDVFLLKKIKSNINHNYEYFFDDEDANISKEYIIVGDWYKYNFVYLFFDTHINTNKFHNYVDNEYIDLFISNIKDDLEYFDSLCIVDGKFNKDIYNNIEKYVDVKKLKLETRSGFFFGDTRYNKYHIDILKIVLEDIIKSKEVDCAYYYNYSY